LLGIGATTVNSTVGLTLITVVVLVAAAMAENAAEPRDRESEVSCSSGSRRRRLPAIPPLRTIAGNGVGRLDSRRGGLTAEHNGSSLTDVGTHRKSFDLIDNDDLQPRSDGGEMRLRLRDGCTNFS